MNAQFKKRLESFLWRTAMMILAVFVSFVMENLGFLNLDPIFVTIVGLVLGEVSKFLNKELTSK